MKTALQTRCARQQSEIARLLAQNERAASFALAEAKAGEFHRARADEALVALALLRSKFNVPGHEPIFDGARRCVLCRAREGWHA